VKTFINQAAQGDILITKINAIPENLTEKNPDTEGFIVAHSETGHNHVIESEGVQMFIAANDPMIMYITVNNEYADLTHNRVFDKHETIRLKQGNYEIRRQREYTIKGWRRVED
jgi:hypothetical protein